MIEEKKWGSRRVQRRKKKRKGRGDEAKKRGRWRSRITCGGKEEELEEERGGQ